MIGIIASTKMIATVPLSARQTTRPRRAHRLARDVGLDQFTHFPLLQPAPKRSGTAPGIAPATTRD